MIEAGDLVFLHAFGGQHDDRQAIPLALGAHPRQQPQAGLVGQHPVQQDQLRRVFLQKLPCIGDIAHHHRIPAR